MAMNDTNIVKIGHVELVDDVADALRIKARIAQDGDSSIESLPYAFPLLPKTVQSVPKVGEGVVIITMNSGNKRSDRLYIGPIISQPQFQEYCSHSYGRGESMSVLNEKIIEPAERISNNPDSKGSFPNVNDVAIVGRETQDIILKKSPDNESDEIDLRCGIRKYDDIYANNTAKNNKLSSKVIFNNIDPAYIQLKYGASLSSGTDRSGLPIDANSIVNIASDRVNIISTRDESLNVETKNNESLIPTSDLSEMMKNLHQLPHGDALVEFLDLFIRVFLDHKHKHNLLPPVPGTFGYDDLIKYNKNKLTMDLLSEYVRIS